MVGLNAMAEDIFWEEDFSSYKADSVPTGGTYGYACVGTGTKIYDANLAGGASPELLVGKDGGSFSATISLLGMSGSFSLQYKANYDRLTVTAIGATVGEKTASGTTYIIPVTVENGTTSIKLTFTNTTKSNARLDDIKLYQGTAKKPAGLSWGKASTSVTLGGDYANIPTLQNENNLDVTCSTSNDSVCTVTNEGVITVVGAGKSVVTAAFNGNDEFEAQSVSIEITVKDASGTQPTDSISKEIETITVARALAIIDSLENSKTTTETYRVEGVVISFDEAFDAQYGNYTMNIADTATDTLTLKVFRAKNAENKKFTEDIIKVGDKIVVEAKLLKYVKDNVVIPETNYGMILTVNGESTSGINNVMIANGKQVIYNLAGQRIQTAKKGLYIINGKKVILK